MTSVSRYVLRERVETQQLVSVLVQIPIKKYLTINVLINVLMDKQEIQQLVSVNQQHVKRKQKEAFKLKVVQYLAQELLVVMATLPSKIIQERADV
jgi:hypothetical protein